MLDPFSLVAAEEERTGDLDVDVEALGGRTFTAFVAALLLAQVGLFAASLGLMLGYFRGQWALGGALVLGGTAALLVTVVIVRWHRRQR
jgi:hypothetical protein